MELMDAARADHEAFASLMTAWQLPKDQPGRKETIRAARGAAAHLGLAFDTPCGSGRRCGIGRRCGSGRPAAKDAEVTLWKPPPGHECHSTSVERGVGGQRLCA